MIRVGLKDCHVSCILGCERSERTTPRDILVDIDYTLTESASNPEDSIHHAVDYVAVFAVLEKTLKEGKFHLVETAARSLGESVMRAFSAIRSCRICIRKKDPMPSIGLSFAEYSVTREASSETGH